MLPPFWPGACCGNDILSLALLVTELVVVPAVVPEELLKYALAKLRTSNDIANIHVALSKKSVVLRTPNIWFDAPKDDDKPPPLESCTNTTNISSIHAMIVIISRMIAMTILYLFYFFPESISALTSLIRAAK